MAPLLSDSPGNDELAQQLQECLMYARGERLTGPRFGFLTAAARKAPIYLFDSPAFDGLPDVATDGAICFIRASVFAQACAQEQRGPSPALGSMGLILGALALVASASLGLEELDPLGAASAAIAGTPVASLAGASFALVDHDELLASAEQGGHVHAAQVIDSAWGSPGCEALRESVAKALTLDATPALKARADLLAQDALRVGSLLLPVPPSPDYQTSGLAGEHLIRNIVRARQARQEAIELDACARPAAQSRPGPRA